MSPIRPTGRDSRLFLSEGAATSRLRVLTPLLVVAAIVILASPLPSGAEPATHSVTDMTASLDRRIPALMAEFEVPGVAAGLVSGGEVVWVEAYGDASLQPFRPMRPDTVFRAESISKSVTAWGVLRLVDAGLVELDAPVGRYLPEDFTPGPLLGDVTVRRLLTHTAGMPLGTIGVRYAPDEPRPSLLEDLRAEVRVESPPGTSFAYSNVGYNLLELVVEQVTGEDFAEYMDHEVLTPLGMDASSYSWPASRSQMLATGHLLSGAEVPPYVYPARASGGLHTTVGDISRFVAAGSAQHRGTNPVLAAGSTELAHTVQVEGLGIYGAVADGYAFGHFTEVVGDGRIAVWHGGQGTGWMTHFHLVPESGDGIVILTNSQRSWPLIGSVLADWASWTEARAVQMSRISAANSVFRVTVVFLAVVCAVVAVGLAAQIRTGARRFAPLAAEARPRRIIHTAAAIAALAALGWAAAQPYLMVSSLFPSLVERAAALVVVAALLALGAAAFPRQDHAGHGPSARRRRPVP